jgi:hypothetical protein
MKASGCYLGESTTESEVLNTEPHLKEVVMNKLAVAQGRKRL